MRTDRQRRQREPAAGWRAAWSWPISGGVEFLFGAGRRYLRDPERYIPLSLGRFPGTASAGRIWATRRHPTRPGFRPTHDPAGAMPVRRAKACRPNVEACPSLGGARGRVVAAERSVDALLPSVESAQETRTATHTHSSPSRKLERRDTRIEVHAGNSHADTHVFNPARQTRNIRLPGDGFPAGRRLTRVRIARAPPWTTRTTSPRPPSR